MAGSWLITAHVYPTGIFFSSGAHWRAARQFTVRTLHSLGVGQPPMVDKVLQELACLKRQLDSYGGEWGTRLPFPGISAHLRPVFLLDLQASPSPWPCWAGHPATSPSDSSSASALTTRTLCLCPC